MENTFCLDLNWPVPIDLPEITQLQSLPPESKCKHYAIRSDNNLNSFLEKYQLAIAYPQAFYTPPHTSSFIHIDGNGGSIAKINYVFGANGSTMQWFKEKNPGTGQVQDTILDTPYLSYHEKDVEFIYSAEVKQPSMVEVGVPHNVVNATDESRWCLSYLLIDLYHKKTVVWEDACQRLDTFIVKKKLNS
jgi:hypothetical protein